METELELLRIKSTVMNDYHEYTSLRDIVLNAPPSSSQGISIRNELVKHAAAAYVQSAFLASRNRGGLAGLAARIRRQMVCRRLSLRACLHVVYRFVHRMMIGVERVWSGRIMIM